MAWLLPRFLSGALALLVGGLIGMLVGRSIDAAVLGTLAGCLSGLLIVATFDAVRGSRLLRWLRMSPASTPPRDAGLWGEVGYRIEKTLRALESDVRRERSRLEQFLSAIEASPNGVLLLDRLQQIEWCNSVAADHFGLDPVRDLRQPVTNLVRSPTFVSFLKRGLFDAPVVFAGPGAHAQLSVLLRHYGDGQLLLLSRDITERERSDAMRRDFVANVSHEIRTPLTVLTGFVETMAQLKLSDAEQQRVLTLMMQQARRMQSLVDDLLMLAQLEGSPPPAPDQWISLGRLMQNVHAQAQALSLGRHVLHFESVGYVFIAGAENEVQSSISNLVHNAIRYTPPGGKVVVTWRTMADGSGQLSVSDTGPGIAREHLPRLTERFYRVDSARSRDTGGTGLGLAIVKHAIQRHGGELSVESELGKGSTFRLSFPAARVRIGDSAPTDAAEVDVAEASKD
jgi:two-component system, OmpR family, phosphate regulon sensor histidine kinase PhoR